MVVFVRGEDYSRAQEPSEPFFDYGLSPGYQLGAEGQRP